MHSKVRKTILDGCLEMSSLNGGYMLLMMKIFGLYRVRWKKKMKLTVIHFAMCLCVSFICIYHGWIWSTQFIDYSFHFRNLFSLVHMIIFFISPVMNLIKFGLINKFDFTLWHKRIVEKLLEMKIRVRDSRTLRVQRFGLCCVFLNVFINVIILYFLHIPNFYDYIPLVLVELWALLPVLEYFRVILVILTLHRTVLRRILFAKRISLVYGCDDRHWPVYLRNYSPKRGKTLKKLKKIRKIILNVCYDVIPNEYGLSILVLVISYVLSFLHDVIHYLPVLLEMKVAASFTSRTIFKFIFLIIFFSFGENSTNKIRNGIKDIHKAIIVETAFPIDYQLKNLSLNYLPRDLTFKAGSLMRITCEHYLSIISILTGYVILQIQAQMVWRYDSQ